jgi:hypothetical protein
VAPGAAIALGGAALVVIGAIAGDGWLALLGVVVILAAPSAILIAAIRAPENGAPRDRTRYRDGFVTGTMTVLGFKPSEQDEARRQRAKQQRPQ